MAKARLTDRFVASVKAPLDGRLEIFDQDVRGLILRVSPAGKKSWVFRYRTRDNVQRRHALGVYLHEFDQSDANTEINGDAKQQALSLSQARSAARDITNRVSIGQDPSSQREQILQEAKAEPIKTFNNLKDAYFAAVETGEWRPREKAKKPSTIVRERQMWITYVEQPLGKLDLEDVTAPRIKLLLRDLVAKGNGTTSNRVRALMRQILNFGVSEDKLVANPVDKVKALAPEKTRERVLSDAEMKSIWEVLDDPAGLLVPDLDPKKPYSPLQVSEQVRLILKLLLLTLARRSEVAGMRVDELNLDQSSWTIPGARTKNGKSNFVPLSPMAKSLVEQALELRTQFDLASSPYVFPSPRGTGSAITPNPVSHGMRDICRAINIENATTHDLRRTAASIMASERLKVPPFLIGRLLNHSGENGGAAAVTMKVYALYDYAPEKRNALGSWAELLALINFSRSPPHHNMTKSL
jgi:integrase